MNRVCEQEVWDGTCLACIVGKVPVQTQHKLCTAQRASPAEFDHLVSCVAAFDLALQNAQCAAQHSRSAKACQSATHHSTVWCSKALHSTPLDTNHDATHSVWRKCGELHRSSDRAQSRQASTHPLRCLVQLGPLALFAVRAKMHGRALLLLHALRIDIDLT